MEIAGYILLSFLLIALNAFFVLAEFAIVKIRPTQVAPRAARGDRKAARVERMLGRLDEYLSVSQVGITLSSIGLGFVGEPGFAELLKPLLAWAGAATEALAAALAVSLGFLLVSFLHIVLGELVPKSVAIRATERAVYAIAAPMAFFRGLFIAPIWLLNGSVNLVLRLFRVAPGTGHTAPSEEELRAILGESEESGVMSFRRLLYLENVLDLGALQARNAMRPRQAVRTLRRGMPLDEAAATILACKYSRYPVVAEDPLKPVGVVNLKDLFLAGLAEGRSVGSIAAELVRPALRAKCADPLEQLLAAMQRTGNHVAFVYDDAGLWQGMVTLEDAVEEVLGSIEEEYPVEPPLTLAGFLKPDRVFLDVGGNTVEEAARDALRRIPPGELPLPADEILALVAERERQGGSFLGRHLAVPHGRLPVATEPIVIVARPRKPIPLAALPAGLAGEEEVRLIIILLTPADTPRVHQVLLSRIALMYDSDFLEERLYDAKDPRELRDVIVTAEQVVLG